jgi:hypothetical protein
LVTTELTFGERATGQAAVETRERLPEELRAFWWASLIVVALTVVVGWLKYRAGTSPYNWFPLSDRMFFDLREYPGTYTLLHTAAFFNNVAGRPWPYPMYSPVAYPPFAAMVMAPMYAFPIPELLFSMVSAAWLAVLLWWAGRALVRDGIGMATAVLFPLTLVATSFPIARLIHQGNIELVVWMFTAVGVLAFLRGRDDAAAVLWGLAAAMKLFPLVLLGMLLPRRRYRAFAVGLGTFVGATVASLWWLGPSIGVAWRGSLKNVFGYQSARLAELTLPSLASNHSVAELVKVAALIAHYPPDKLTLPYYAGGVLVLALAFVKKLWTMPAANQLLALSAFMMMLPTISYFHALVHMYAPFAVLCGLAIRAHRAGVIVPGLKTTMLLFAPLFAPFTVLTFPQVLLFCGLVQGVVLMTLFVRALEFPLELPQMI